MKRPRVSWSQRPRLGYATVGLLAVVRAKRGQPSYEYTDKVVAWCQDQGISK